MSVTTAQQQQLDALQTAYNKALSDYQTEQTDNYNFKAGLAAAQQGVNNGNNADWWAMMVNASNQSLETKFAKMDVAKKAVDSYVDFLNKQAENEFKNNNPQEYAQIQIQRDATEKQAEIEKQKALYAQKNTMYIIVAGVVIAIIVIGAFVYKRLFR